jgi:hypothetical protein
MMPEAKNRRISSSAETCQDLLTDPNGIKIKRFWDEICPVGRFEQVPIVRSSSQSEKPRGFQRKAPSEIDLMQLRFQERI